MKLNKKRVRKKIVSFNIVSFFFFVLSCISLTFAWFAYNNVIKMGMEIEVSSWSIEIKDENDEVYHELPITLEEFYPGIDNYVKNFEVYNDGDIDATFGYKISYVRIFDQEFNVENQEQLEDQLAHNYPFSFNITVDSDYIAAGDSLRLNISLSWPLDSDDDELDTIIGARAYKFNQEEEAKKLQDETYEKRSIIEIILDLNSMQHLEEDLNIMDNRFLYGNSYSIDINTLKSCDIGEINCYNFHVIDTNNKLSDDKVTLMLDPKAEYKEIDFNNLNSLNTENMTSLTTKQVLTLISKDIVDTNIVISNRSNRILGNILYSNRVNQLLNDVATNNGEINFNRNVFNFLGSEQCIWTDTIYKNDLAYAIGYKNDSTLRLYGENKNTNCKFIPVIKTLKNNIIN